MAVAEIAVRAGYGSPEGFGRAFKDAYGKAPADYRSNGSHAAFKAANSTGDAAGFPVSVVTLPKIRCAAVSHTGTYMQIDKAMGTLFGGLAAQGLLTHGTRMIGVFFDDSDMVPVEKLRSMACSPVEADAYRWLWGVWLPSSGYEPAEAPVFEEYLNSPRDVAPTELPTDIFLPLASVA